MIDKAVEVDVAVEEEWKTERQKTLNNVKLVRRFVTPTNADLFSYHSSDASAAHCSTGIRAV